MNNTLKIILIGAGVIAVAGLLFFAGNVSAQQGWFGRPAQSYVMPGPMMGYGSGAAGRMMNGAYQSGMMQGFQMGSQMGGLMSGGWGPGYRQGSVELEISAEEALEIAQSYLDENQPGAVAELAGRPGWHGYYHFQVVVDDEVVDILSVDGASGEIFEHSGDCPWFGQDTDESTE